MERSQKRQRDHGADVSEQPNSLQEEHPSSSSEEKGDSDTQLITVPISSTNDGTFVSISDITVLDCPVCNNPLSIPVFQCEYGHIACSSCCDKIAYNCHSCNMPIGYNRGRAIEKVLESVKLPCQNLKYGCQEMVFYSKKFDHDRVCNKVPCPCPLLSCKFASSYSQLYRHFGREHKDSASCFQFNTTFPVAFSLSDRSLILQEEKDNVLFFFEEYSRNFGNVITLCCIGPPASELGYYYKLEVRKGKKSTRLMSYTENIQNVEHDEHLDPYLIVTESFLGVTSGKINLNVCIWDHSFIPSEISTSTTATN